MVKRDTRIVLLILAAALLLRLPLLGYSFYGDEGFSLLRDSLRLLTDTEDRFRPVFFTLLYLWRQLGFHGEIGLRLLPLLFGLAQIPLAYAVGLKLGGRRLATAYTLLLAASPMLIEFSQELRMYSLVALLALWQVWLLLQLRERRTTGRWLAFVAVALVGMYTHLHYALFLVGLAVTFVRERRAIPLRQAALALGAVVLLYLPNLFNLQEFVARRGGEYAVHLPSAMPKLVAAFAVGFSYFSLPDQGLGRAVDSSDLAHNLPLALLVALPALLIGIGLLRRHLRGPRDRALWLGYEAFVIPVLLALIASMITRQYWLQPKYLIFAAPFALWLVAVGFCELPGRLLKLLTTALGAAVIVVSLAHFWSPEKFGRREDWRGAAGYLQTQMTPQSVVLVVPGSYRLLDYYWPAAPAYRQSIFVPDLDGPAGPFVHRLRSQLAGKTDIYYLWFDIRQNIADPRDVLLHSLDYLGVRVETRHFNPRLKLYHWRLDPPPDPPPATQLIAS